MLVHGDPVRKSPTTAPKRTGYENEANTWDVSHVRVCELPFPGLLRSLASARPGTATRRSHQAPLTQPDEGAVHRTSQLRVSGRDGGVFNESTEHARDFGVQALEEDLLPARGNERRSGYMGRQA